MNTEKNIIVILFLIFSLAFTGLNLARAQEQAVEPTKSSFFKSKEIREKERNERKAKRENQIKEKEEAKKELLEARKALQADTAYKQFMYDKTREQGIKNSTRAKELIYNRSKEVKKAKKNNRYVEVITNENDPIYIANAGVLGTETKFLRIKNVEFNYKLNIQNQTPKIINYFEIVWERKISFNESQTIMKETKVSKPLIPYENRVVEYNDLDSKRDGETYKVLVAKVIFEDGTQWRNPNIRNPQAR